ncbi:hypothetical protein IWW39_001446 [Coemansia spiralis]|uniref:F-box domain-containing protein n=1 Tax=Coemansia spiralis TaxID=417178 RepID=A0A9W8GN78_9FUNG|nr:hypothetical protein IWW39_001446 [Coemansia spiralis]
MRLPYDLAVLVAKRLSAKDVFHCSLVNKDWHRLFTSDDVLHPLVAQFSHYDQEPLLLRCMPNGHVHHGEEKDEEVAEEGKDPKAEAEAERIKLEDLANQQWMKSSRVLARGLGKTLNRERRWRRAEPTCRLYLPPVPMDGSDSDILEEWQGRVKSVKMKGGMVAVLYEKGKSIRIWNLDAEYDEIRDMTERYINDNREILKAQTKYGGPPMPPYEEEQVDALLRCTRSGGPRNMKLKVVKMRIPPIMFDYFSNSDTLVAAAANGEVDVYDMVSGQHQRTLKVGGNLNIGSIHVWLDYLVVGHGPLITLWNHRTGEVLENGLRTSHRAKINGVFVLDNERHLMSIDESGIIVVTNRSAKKPEVETLLDVPLYPMIMVGQMGAPYAMRLLHMTHLCVWGKYSLGHYQLYEPGLGHLPPLNSLRLNTSGGVEKEMPVIQPASAEMSRAERVESESRQILAQLEATHHDLEKIYSEIAGNRSSEHPEGERMARRRMNRVPAEEQYHIINIDPPADPHPDGLVLSVDFRHVVYLHRNYITVQELDKGFEGEEGAADVDEAGQEGASVGLYPIDRATRAFGPPKSGRSLRQVFEQSKAKKAPGGEPGSGSGHEALVAEVEGEDGYETVTDDELPEEDELEEDVAENEQHNIEVTMRNLRMQTWRREVRRLVMERGKWNLRRLESALIRFTLGLTIEKDEPVFGMVPMHKTSLWYGRKFMAEEVPELLAEIDAGMLDINMLLETVPFYAQRLHESWFREPVLNVDHRGQVTTAARLLRDMERVYRAARVPAAKMQWSRSADFVSKAVCFLQHRHTAMDDGRVAVGCENGYVVVLSFD